MAPISGYRSKAVSEESQHLHTSVLNLSTMGWHSPPGTCQAEAVTFFNIFLSLTSRLSHKRSGMWPR